MLCYAMLWFCRGLHKCFSYKSQLANAHTSLPAVFYDKTFLIYIEGKKKNLWLTACRCSQRFSLSDRMNQEVNFRVRLNELCREPNLIK